MTESFAFLVATFAVLLAFEAVNGWTDAPNAIATVVSTRVLPPMYAVAMAAALNLVGALSGTAVATTIGKGVVNIDAGIGLTTVFAGAFAVVSWSSLAVYLRMPVSESHGLLAGLAGAAVQEVGFDALIANGWAKTFAGMGFSLAAGFSVAFLIMLALLWVFRNANPSGVRRRFGYAQILSSAFMAWSHGTSDGQKAMGAMAMALALHNGASAEEFSVPLWIIILAATTMGLSTLLGGWRIIKTLGMGVTHLETHQGFAAETAAAGTLAMTSLFGIPVSTTHTIGSAIMGVGATRRLSAVRWGLAYHILLAWVFTFPICFGIGFGVAAALPS
jgi:PiT family inorganic phosphate transporter